MGLSNKSSKMEITPARCTSDGGEIVEIGLVRQAHFFATRFIYSSSGSVNSVIPAPTSRLNQVTAFLISDA